MASSGWPKDVGIIGIELYFPASYVDQNDLEVHDGVSKGKYTIGLGQQRMGFCSDREDVNSMSLTVLESLVRKFRISYGDIGRLEVGTETLIDKSKSVKSVLMKLFEESGNSDVEGVDSTNACYGGTAALFNCISWIESSYWDGRYAVAVCADIAVYASGNARPTGGAGAVAMLIGPNAPLVFDRGLRASHVQHVYDFYKPNMSSEYPVVDGKLSIECYFRALDKCYQLYCQKAEKLEKSETISLQHFDAMIFHTPFCKLVQKSFARLSLNDYVRCPISLRHEKFSTIVEKIPQFQKLQDTYFDREVEKTFMELTESDFIVKTKPSLLLATQVGNMYTPSLYASLVSLLCQGTVKPKQKIGLFSYGSGLASSLFSITVKGGPGLDKILSHCSSVKDRLEMRTKISPAELDKCMKNRESIHDSVPFSPSSDVTLLFPETWYLEKIDEKHRRTYNKTSAKTLNGHC